MYGVAFARATSSREYPLTGFGMVRMIDPGRSEVREARYNDFIGINKFLEVMELRW
jgi:hypothetical protein